MASATDGTSGAAASPAQPCRALEELAWDETFVCEMPADPCSDNIPRQVLHACYTKVSPSAPVENPKLVAWSTAVADILDLDHKESNSVGRKCALCPVLRWGLDSSGRFSTLGVRGGVAAQGCWKDSLQQIRGWPCCPAQQRP